MSLWVTVTGPPSLICLLNNGTTDPLLPKTFPKRTATYSVSLSLSFACIIISHILLVAPITFVGLTALSVEIKMNRFVLYLSHAFTRLYVPNTLFLTASEGLFSINGTCLCAAAWKTTSGENSSNKSNILCSSLIFAMIALISLLGYFPFNSNSILYKLFS